MKIDYYINALNIDNLIKKSDYLYNCKCPLCGDSKKNLRKRRGYIYLKNNDWLFHCHNCNIHISFKQFLYKIDIVLYKKWLFDELKNDNIEVICKENIENNDNDYINPNLFQFYKLNDNFLNNNYYKPIVEKINNYLIERKMEFIKDKVYLSLNNKWFLRIIFPIEDKNGMYGFQARTINKKNNIRYLTYYHNKEKAKLYNYYHVNKNNYIYVLEGLIDSLFIENSIAMLTSKLNFINTDLENYKDKLIFIFDNDETGKIRTEEYLKKNYRCLIFPKKWQKYKDINDIIINENIDKKELINTLIELSDLNGLLRFKLEVY